MSIVCKSSADVWLSWHGGMLVVLERVLFVIVGVVRWGSGGVVVCCVSKWW